MSEVHADLTELLQFAQNIKIAVNSVMAMIRNIKNLAILFKNVIKR